MTEITNFNIRVYGIIINTKNEILISTENYGDRTLRKFIGGGLEKGEGIKNALEREFMEELSSEILVKELFYINDFFQASFFKKEDQIISIYYLVSPKDWAKFMKKIDLNHLNQKLSWHELKSFNSNNLSLPIDKVVLEKLKHKKTQI